VFDFYQIGVKFATQGSTKLKRLGFELVDFVLQFDESYEAKIQREFFQKAVENVEQGIKFMKTYIQVMKNGFVAKLQGV